jgi:hypothetical protein
MLVNGRDCSIVIKTDDISIGIPYAVETIREAVTLLTEEAAIEGDGTCRAIARNAGVTGCVVTPLTIGTVPPLLYLAMGHKELPGYVSETRNIYRYKLSLLPVENSARFDVVQDRGAIKNEQLAVSNGRRLFEDCRVQNFELRIAREEAIKLRLDITNERPAAVYPYENLTPTELGERFMGGRVSYLINGTEYRNIYGLTLSSKKEGGTRTELRIKRSREQGPDIPGLINELTITARLLRDSYEYRYHGIFRLTLTRLVLAADETIIESADAVIGSPRYYVAGKANAEVFTNNEELIMKNEN